MRSVVFGRLLRLHLRCGRRCCVGRKKVSRASCCRYRGITLVALWHGSQKQVVEVVVVVVAAIIEAVVVVSRRDLRSLRGSVLLMETLTERPSVMLPTRCQHPTLSAHLNLSYSKINSKHVRGVRT